MFLQKHKHLSSAIQPSHALTTTITYVMILVDHEQIQSLFPEQNDKISQKLRKPDLAVTFFVGSGKRAAAKPLLSLTVTGSEN